jgi:Ser/Thr protein kinase RdoA (MazF antagonist)
MDDRLADAAIAEWLGTTASRTPIQAMNSSTWLVRADDRRFVLKISAQTDEAGLEVAAWLADRGVRTGPPLRREIRDGRLVALLRFEDGRPLTPDDAATVGAALGRVHAHLLEAPRPEGLDRWPWRWLQTDSIRDERLRRAAEAAVERVNGLVSTVTASVLHGDPAPEAFLDDGRDVALIDWGAACEGPLLYDVASAWMYTDRQRPLIDGYAAAGPLPPSELELLPTFLAMRWAVQASYFSARIAADDLTGLSDRAENEKGLADARRALLG